MPPKLLLLSLKCPPLLKFFSRKPGNNVSFWLGTLSLSLIKPFWVWAKNNITKTVSCLCIFRIYLQTLGILLLLLNNNNDLFVAREG